MTYIDLAILNLAERLCHKFQLLTGRTNVWLALQLTNLSVIVYFIVYFVWPNVYFGRRHVRSTSSVRGEAGSLATRLSSVTSGTSEMKWDTWTTFSID
jgi:hypothetical protein